MPALKIGPAFLFHLEIDKPSALGNTRINFNTLGRWREVMKDQ